MFCPLTKEDCRTDCMLFSVLDGECRISIDSSIGVSRYARKHEPSPMQRHNMPDGTYAHPTWNDGNIVIPGQIAISLRGPKRIVTIEKDRGGWRLYDEHEYIIDEGKFTEHPTRMGEPCDFWPETDEEVTQDGE